MGKKVGILKRMRYVYFTLIFVILTILTGASIEEKKKRDRER